MLPLCFHRAHPNDTFVCGGIVQSKADFGELSRVAAWLHAFQRQNRLLAISEDAPSPLAFPL
jgi:hypothetical protein